MNLKCKIGYKLYCFVNYWWKKTDLKVFECLNDYFSKWWIDEYLKGD